MRFILDYKQAQTEIWRAVYLNCPVKKKDPKVNRVVHIASSPMSHTLAMHWLELLQHGSEAEKRKVKSAVAKKIPGIKIGEDVKLPTSAENDAAFRKYEKRRRERDKATETC